jgi:NodT family efflux transporter outer membrane factor (OMF) lipoprotein
MVSALALSACAAGPDYVAPTPPSASSGPFISSPLAAGGTPAFAQAPVQQDWWRLYEDPVLDQLIADALAANTDVRVAVARLEKARASLRGARSDRLPQTSLSASGDYGRVPAGQRQPGAQREDWAIDGGLSVSYEVDLFGRVSRGVEAARGDADAAAADADAVRVAVVADTTRAYADAASGAAQLSVAREIVGLLDRLLGLTQRRQEAGLVNSLDVARIATLRDQRAADIPRIEAQRQAALFRLATLTGRAPNALPEIAARRSVNLEIARPIPVGDGTALLARRPDVRAAERRLAADTARIGVATADLYPKISLGGSVGSTGNDIAGIFGAGPLRWLLGGLISWNFPNQEAARARIAGAEADSRASLATFDGAVLNALEETETALSNYARSLERRQALKSARDFAEKAATITRAQQREGAIDTLQQLDTERTFAEAEAALALQDALVAQAQIDVFRALAGGWSA